MFAKIFLPILFGAVYSSLWWCMATIRLGSIAAAFCMWVLILSTAGLIIGLALAALVDYSIEEM